MSYKNKYPLLSNECWLRQKYVEEKFTTKEIAKLVGGSTREAVFYSLKKFKIDRVFRFPELQNKEWLYQKYEIEKQSTPGIAELVGCSSGAVANALKLFRIKIRNISDARIVAGFESHYSKLNDANWLREKYITEGLSTKKICKMSGAKTPNSVRQSLIRYGIPVRSISDGLTLNREDDGFTLDLDVINGCLLGDGFLGVWNKQSNSSYPCFCKKNIYRDHVEWVGKIIFPNNWKTRIKKCEEWRPKLKNKKYIIYQLRSLSHKELLPLYRKWYPEQSGFKKIVPADIEINEIVLLHWFLDDGSSHLRIRKYKNHWTQKKKQIRIVFCSESFIKKDQEMLCDKIHKQFPVLTPNLHKVKFGAGYRIGIPQSQAQTFFDIIGPSPVPSLGYKWK